MEGIDRITRNPKVMGGKPCIRGMRITVGLVVGMLSGGTSEEELLELYPELELEDIRQSLRFAALAVNDREITLAAG